MAGTFIYSYLLIAIIIIQTRLCFGVLAPCSDVQADIVFALDSSCLENNDEEWNMVKGYFAKVAENIGVNGGNIKYGLMHFTSNNTHKFYLNNKISNVSGEIMNAPRPLYQKRSNVTKAIEGLENVQFQHGDRAEAHNIAVIFLHTHSDNQTTSRLAAEQAQEKGLLMFAVGVGVGSELKGELECLSSAPHHQNSSWFLYNNYNEMESDENSRKLALAICKKTKNLSENTTSGMDMTPSVDDSVGTDIPAPKNKTSTKDVKLNAKDLGLVILVCLLIPSLTVSIAFASYFIKRYFEAKKTTKSPSVEPQYVSSYEVPVTNEYENFPQQRNAN